MTNLFVVVSVALAATVTSVRSQQCTPGCSAAPTVIQLQCGGNGAGSSPAPAPPPPAPAPATNSSTSPKNEFPEGYDPHMCTADDQGNFLREVPGGFPNGFNQYTTCFGENMGCAPVVSWNDPDVRPPPPQWDGRLETLGFPVEPYTKQYNMLLCWPVSIAAANFMHGVIDPTMP